MAGVIAFYLKDYVDSRNPLYAIPQLLVTADSEAVPIELAGYDWEFANGSIASMPPVLHYYVEPRPAELLGGEQLQITLSTDKPLDLNISRTANYTYDLAPTEDDLIVPFESGSYLYEVYARYPQGWVLYYFRIVVL